MLNEMLWIARSGAQWRELPEVYGPRQFVYAHFAKWRGKEQQIRQLVEPGAGL